MSKLKDVDRLLDGAKIQLVNTDPPCKGGSTLEQLPLRGVLERLGQAYSDRMPQDQSELDALVASVLGRMASGIGARIFIEEHLLNGTNLPERLQPVSQPGRCEDLRL